MSNSQEQLPSPPADTSTILSGISNEFAYDSSSSDAHKEAERKLSLITKERHYNHRYRWSNWVLGFMAWILGFQSVLIICVGFNLLDFTQYEWLLPTLLVQHILEIAALALFIVKALFTEPDKHHD